MEQAQDREGICLCVLFNHPYVANLPLLRRLYQGRFRHVRFLMPLVRSDDADVLTVYRGSFAHHAYLGDHVETLRALGCAHYVLIHDDVLLSPWLDESNIVAALGIQGPGEGFIGNLEPVPADVGDWGFQAGTLSRLLYGRNIITGTGTDALASVLASLPPVEVAVARAALYGLPGTTTFSFTERSLDPDQTLAGLTLFDPHRSGDREFLQSFLEMTFGDRAPTDIVVPYPMALSGPHADFIVIPDSCVHDYVHVAGVFAAAGVFVEMASPTALMLSCDRVRTLRDAKRRVDLSDRPELPWEAIDRMLADPDLILIHPIKLSQVQDQDGFVDMIELARADRAALIEIFAEAAVLAEFPAFDPTTYLRLNPDVTTTSAFVHFRLNGRSENRRWRD